MYKFEKQIYTDCKCYREAGTMRGLPQGMVIHGTGCDNPWLKRWARANGVDIGNNPYKNYFGGENNPICTPHATAGLNDDGEIKIVQILPYTRRCWCCGAGRLGSYNDTHIQIEIAQDFSRGEKYCKDIFRAVAEWCADLITEYKFDVSDIVSHKEACAAGYASNHGDPENWLDEFGLNMDWFRDMVDCILSDRKGTTPDKNANFAVQVGAFSLRQNAENYKKELKRKYGIDGFVVDKSK